MKALATKSKSWKGYFTDVTTHEAVFRYFPRCGRTQPSSRRSCRSSRISCSDVTSGSLPSYSLIHDLPTVNGHDCTDGGACLGPVDARLRETIDAYINHPSFVANNDLLIIAFDEAQLTDKTCSGPMTIAMTEAARIRGAWKCGGHTVAMLIGGEASADINRRSSITSKRSCGFRSRALASPGRCRARPRLRRT